MPDSDKAMYLIQLLLPIHSNNKEKFPAEYFAEVRRDLTSRFGGVTAFLRSPAEGLWKEGEEGVQRDEVVMFEVMTKELDKKWWADYRTALERRFSQQELLFWAMNVTRL